MPVRVPMTGSIQGRHSVTVGAQATPQQLPPRQALPRHVPPAVPAREQPHQLELAEREQRLAGVGARGGELGGSVVSGANLLERRLQPRLERVQRRLRAPLRVDAPLRAVVPLRVVTPLRAG